ncbi:hypothetical protein [Tomitella gaofuii]|uniref:hypothetical protein n=1 Tax=Tomitella gaofuii TaxID=2760083 RepID=UPI0015F7ADB7
MSLRIASTSNQYGPCVSSVVITHCGAEASIAVSCSSMPPVAAPDGAGAVASAWGAVCEPHAASRPVAPSSR